MDWRDYDKDNCSVGRTLGLIGERWTLLVLREAFLGVRRFGEFQRHTGAAKNILSDRLHTLVAGGVLERRLYEERPPRHEYRLTEKGLDLYPVLVSLMQWGDKYESDASGPPVLMRHKGCNEIVAPQLTCPGCGEAIGARDMVALAGPGAVLKQTA